MSITNGNNNNRNHNHTSSDNNTHSNYAKLLTQQNLFFTDGKGGKPLNAYFGMLELFMSKQGISASTLMEDIHVTLKDAPSAWYWDVFRASPDRSYDAFKIGLKARFSSYVDNAEAITQAVSVKYSGNGNLLTHVDKVTGLLSNAGVHTQQLIGFITQSLPLEMRRLVASNNCTSIDQFSILLKKTFPDMCYSSTDNSSEQKKKFQPGEFNKNNAFNKVFGRSVAAICRQATDNSQSEDVEVSPSESQFDSAGDSYANQATVNDDCDNKFSDDPKEDFIAKVCAFAMNFNNRNNDRYFPSNRQNFGNNGSNFNNNRPNTQNAVKSGNIGATGSRCYNCNQVGHGFNTCTVLQTRFFCFSCGKPDQVAATCNSARCVAKRSEQQKN